jgi:hypothetical protein
MAQNSTHRNQIKLPTIGAELFTYLKDVNDHESFTASMRLKDLLSERLRIEINSWFIAAPLPELDQTLLRKITNSLLSAGLLGQKRTKEALSEIRLDPSNMSHFKNVSEATDHLRNWARDYRSAKGFLDYQYKCVNSFLRVQKTTNDESVRNLLRKDIEHFSSFKEWQRELEEYWNKKGLVRENLRSSYQNIFEIFMGTFDDQLQNGIYHKFLDGNWQRYIGITDNPIDQPFFETPPDSSTQISNFQKDEALKPFEVDLQVEGGEIFYHITCHRLTEFQASELRFKIALALSKDERFINSRFSVAIIASDAPVILIRTAAPENESAMSSIVTFLEQILEESKLAR